SPRDDLQISRCRLRVRPDRRQDLQQAGDGSRAGVDARFLQRASRTYPTGVPRELVTKWGPEARSAGSLSHRKRDGVRGPSLSFRAPAPRREEIVRRVRGIVVPVLGAPVGEMRVAEAGADGEDAPARDVTYPASLAQTLHHGVVVHADDRVLVADLG